MRKLTIFFLVSILMWLTYFAVVWFFIPQREDRAAFGDTFGAFSALFTGLALAGTAYALHCQDQQTREQRDQIKIQAELQTKTASALERNSTIELVTLLEAMRKKNSEELVTSMKMIHQYKSDPAAEAAIIEQVAAAKGHARAQGLLNHAHITSFDMLISAWNLAPELANAVAGLSKPFDQDQWEAMIDDLADSTPRES